MGIIEHYRIDRFDRCTQLISEPRYDFRSAPESPACRLVGHSINRVGISRSGRISLAPSRPRHPEVVKSGRCRRPTPRGVSKPHIPPSGPCWRKQYQAKDGRLAKPVPHNLCISQPGNNRLGGFYYSVLIASKRGPEASRLCAGGDRVCEARKLGSEAEVFADPTTIKERVESASSLGV